ncbi:MAG: DUF3352 domain-containing protein [Elainella sp. Prado103]|nr:DUF3352 domain-containing protein [Elainella sp. Prado103]
MKLRSFFSILAVVVVALVSVGAIGAYWIAASRPVPVVQPIATQPTGTMFVSRQAPLMASLLINPDRLDAGVGGMTISPSLPGRLRRLQESLFGKVGFDYDRDLKPWLGDEVTAAITTADLDRDETNGLQPGYLTVLSVQDADGAREAMQRFWRRSGLKDRVTESFAGVEISAVDRGENSFASALVGDQYVLLANSPKVIREALNGVQVPELSLEQNERYQQAIERFAGKKVGFVFANLPDAVAWRWIQGWVGSDRELAADGVEDSLAIALKPVAQGLVAEAELFLSQGKLKSVPAEPLDLAEIRSFVPNGSRFAIVAANLEQTWQRWQNSGLVEADQLKNPRMLQWGLEPETLFEWAQGNFVLAESAGTDRTQSNWLFVTERSTATDAGIEQLNQRAQQQGLSLGSFKLGDQTIYAWTKLVTTKSVGSPNLTSLQTQVQGVHTAIDQYEVFATALESLGLALATRTADSEISDLQVAAAQIGSTDGYLYLSQDGLQAIWQGVPMQAVVQQAMGVRSAVLSRNIQDPEGWQGTVVLFLEGN